jgi:hypothetical protein
MGQTVNLQLPWPEDTDPVMAGAQAIRALAEGIDNAPQYLAERYTTAVIGGGGADVIIGSAGVLAWELVKANFTVTPSSGPFTIPRAGVWHVYGIATWNNTNWTTAGTWSAGVKSSGGKELVNFRYENAGGTQRRTFPFAGDLVLVAGETLAMFVANNSGANGNIAGCTVNGDRWTTRFGARWLRY